jgi:hypothetical protein
VALLAGLLALGVASSAHAQKDVAEEDRAEDRDEDRAAGVGVIDDLDPEAVPPSPARTGAAPSAQAGAQPAARPGSARWGDGRASRNPRQQPARGAPYAWRQMTLAAVIMLAMLGVLVWVIRRQTRAR